MGVHRCRVRVAGPLPPVRYPMSTLAGACNCYARGLWWLATEQKGAAPMADVTKTVKDAAYVTVGLGVLAFQKAQVARRDLTKQVEAQLNQTSDQVKDLSKKVEGRIQPVLGQLEQTVPAQAKDLVKQARTAAEALQGQVLNRTNGRTNGTKKTKAA